MVITTPGGIQGWREWQNTFNPDTFNRKHSSNWDVDMPISDIGFMSWVHP
jgi:hypothetical protein